MIHGHLFAYGKHYATLLHLHTSIEIVRENNNLLHDIRIVAALAIALAGHYQR